MQKDNNFYPQNPENKKISRYPVNYRGYLGCKDPLYLFQNCSRRNESSVRSVFWQDMWANIPSTRKKSTEQQRDCVTAPSFNTNADSGTTENRSSSGLGWTPSFTTNTNSSIIDSSSSSGLAWGKNGKFPAWMMNPSGNVVRNTSKSDSSDVESWFLPIMARITAIDVATILPMPIQVNNNLPCIDFYLSSKKKNDLRMRMLADSGAAMNSGNKSYYQ